MHQAGWLGGPVLIPGEDPEAFAQFSSRIHADLGPLDAIEEILRLHLLRLGSAVGDGSKQGCSGRAATRHEEGTNPLIGAEKADALPQGWAKGDRAKVAEVEQLMTSGLLSLDVALAESATTKVDIILRVDGLQAAAARKMRRLFRGDDGLDIDLAVTAATDVLFGTESRNDLGQHGRVLLDVSLVPSRGPRLRLCRKRLSFDPSCYSLSFAISVGQLRHGYVDGSQAAGG